MPALGPCRWAGLVLFIAISLYSAQPHAQNTVLGDGQANKTYIFPILRFGPNNQKRDLRHTLALAKYLDCGIILTGFYRHYWDIQHRFGLNERKHPNKTNYHEPARQCFKETIRDFMELEEVVNRTHITEWLPSSATAAELKLKGWDGTLDAVMYSKNWWHLGKRDIEKSLKASGVVVSPEAEHIVVNEHLACKPGVVAKIKKSIAPYRFVGVVFVLLGAAERPRLPKEGALQPKDKCQKVMHQADRLLQPASWIDDLARKYIKKHLGGEPYLAVHIRPYPDSCLDEWRTGDFNDEKLKQRCQKELIALHLRLTPCTRQLMAAANLTRVFVMTHPVIRQVVDALLTRDGLRAHYLDVSSVAELAGCHDSSATFMALVEEQLAVHAHTLLGTSTSSITQTIAFERMGKGIESNFYFEFLKC